ncbi:MAG TPA: hypothetical protein VGQ39_16345 [Pyrinomonadaceae bacterium]|jgi:hypothetical protein|nr:hypothetical protein [Pyrinomonadaceae bacterium]
MENIQVVDQLPVDEVVALASVLAKRYEISSTRALVEMISKLATDDALNVGGVGLGPTPAARENASAKIAATAR